MLLRAPWRSALVLALLVAGCSGDDSSNTKVCPKRAAFELTLSAVKGALPSDTLLHVQYGGGVEEFRLSDTTHAQEVVLCTELGPDGGAADGGAGVTELQCELWTQGAATVTVTATGFPMVVKELAAQAEGKCIVTVPVDVVLGDQDATL